MRASAAIPRAALAALIGGGAVLFLSEATWLQVAAAAVLLVGVALGVAAIATPDFLEADRPEVPGEEDEG